MIDKRQGKAAGSREPSSAHRFHCFCLFRSSSDCVLDAVDVRAPCPESEGCKERDEEERDSGGAAGLPAGGRVGGETPAAASHGRDVSHQRHRYLLAMPE